MSWWSLAARSVGRLTTPSADVAGVDDAIGRMLRTSGLGNVAAGLAAVVDRAWRHARLRRVARLLVVGWVAMTRRERTQCLGWTAAVSGATALVTQWLKAMPVGSLRWVVPVVIVVCGLLLTGAAQVARRIPNES